MPILGAKSYLMLCNESQWSVPPSSPAYIPVPVSQYDVRFRPESRQSTPLIGVLQRRHSRIVRGSVAGKLVCPLYGWKPAGSTVSIAQFLLQWAFGSPETVEPASCMVDWAEGPDLANRRHTGLRVGTATVRGDAESGQVELSLDLTGRNESALVSAPALPANLRKLTEFEFSDCSLELNGVSVPMRGFELQVQHGLRVEYLNTTVPSYIVRTQRVAGLQVEIFKEDGSWDALRRNTTAADMTGKLILRGLHNGTGTGNWTRVSLDFARLSLIDVEQQSAMNRLTSQPLQFTILKPDTTADDVVQTWSEVE